MKIFYIYLIATLICFLLNCKENKESDKPEEHKTTLKTVEPEKLRKWLKKLKFKALLGDVEADYLLPRTPESGVIVLWDEKQRLLSDWEKVVGAIRANSKIGIVIPKATYQPGLLASIENTLKQNKISKVGYVLVGKAAKPILIESGSIFTLKALAIISPFSPTPGELATMLMESGIPFFMLAGEKDSESANVAKSLKTAAPNFEIHIASNKPDKGIHLLTGELEELRKMILFFEKYL